MNESEERKLWIQKLELELPNQVFVKTGLNINDTPELTSLVDNDNVNGSDKFFWSKPIDNVDKTKGLSKLTSWKTKGKYVSERLNRVNHSYDKAGPSIRNDILSEISSETKQNAY